MAKTQITEYFIVKPGKLSSFSHNFIVETYEEDNLFCANFPAFPNIDVWSSVDENDAVQEAVTVMLGNLDLFYNQVKGADTEEERIMAPVKDPVYLSNKESLYLISAELGKYYFEPIEVKKLKSSEYPVSK